MLVVNVPVSVVLNVRFGVVSVIVPIDEGLLNTGAVLSINTNPPVFDTFKYCPEDNANELISLLLPIYNNLAEEILCVFTVDKVVSSSNSIVLWIANELLLVLHTIYLLTFSFIVKSELTLIVLVPIPTWFLELWILNKLDIYNI